MRISAATGHGRVKAFSDTQILPLIRFSRYVNDCAKYAHSLIGVAKTPAFDKDDSTDSRIAPYFAFNATGLAIIAISYPLFRLLRWSATQARILLRILLRSTAFLLTFVPTTIAKRVAEDRVFLYLTVTSVPKTALPLAKSASMSVFFLKRYSFGSIVAL